MRYNEYKELMNKPDINNDLLLSALSSLKYAYKTFDKIAKFIHSNSETKLAKIILFRTSFESGLLQNFIKAKAKEIKKSAEEQKGNQTPGQNAIKHQDVDPATQAIQDLVALLSKQETKAKLVFRELSRSNVPKIVKQYPELMKYFLFKSRVADDSSAK